jgi:hypothetical protein
MPLINISELADGFVIQFDTASERINAHALAWTLVGSAGLRRKCLSELE